MTATEKDLLFTRLNTTLPVKVLVLVGSLIGRLLPLKNPSALFFFFPFCHVGGAEKVHAHIVRCFSGERPWVFFTKRSVNKGFLKLFGKEAALFDIWYLLKYGYPLSVGIMAGVINRHDYAVVFGSNSLFFYLLVQHLKPGVRAIDLVHAFGGGSECFSLSVAPRLDARVVINSTTVEEFKEQYRQHGLPEDLGRRVHLIENAVEVPGSYLPKKRHPRLKAIYVGRGSEEKRVHLVGQIATRCRMEGMPVDVVVVGDAVEAVRERDRACCTFLGELADPAELARVYDEADLLLLTSSREGFPMVIMEAMAHGVVPVVTAVGGIPIHVNSGKSGWLVEDAAGEEQVVTDICRIIGRICEEPETLERMSRTAYDYARTNFSGERFCSGYRRLVQGSASGQQTGGKR